MVCLILLLVMCLFSRQSVAAPANRSLIFVVDSSEKMAPHLSSVKDVILAHIDQAKTGDYVGIVAFSDMARQLVLKEISNTRDREYIARKLSLLQIAGERGDILKGFERGVESLEILTRRHATSANGIVVISSSDSIQDQDSDRLMASISERITDLAGNERWYVQYCYLGGVSDKRIVNFISHARGFSYDVNSLGATHGTDTIEELYTIISNPEKSCLLRISDSTGSLLGSSEKSEEWVVLDKNRVLSENMRLRVSSDSRCIVAAANHFAIGLSPDTEVTLLSGRINPITAEAVLQLKLKTGTLWIHPIRQVGDRLHVWSPGLSAELSGGDAMATFSEETDEFGIAAFSGALTFLMDGPTNKALTIGPDQSTRFGHGEMLEDVGPAEAGVIEQWKNWSKALIGKTTLASIVFTVPEVSLEEKIILMGPIKSGESQSRTVAIHLKGIQDPSKVKIGLDISIDLPDGLALSTGVLDGDDPRTKTLSLTIDGRTGFHSGRAEKYTGLMKIQPADDSEVVFEKIPVPLTVETKGPFVSLSTLLLGFLAVVLAAVALRVGLAVRSKEVTRPRPHRVVGRLIVINDPTGGRIGTINLEEISTRSSRLSLTIGRDRAAEIRLKHSSVSSTHCTIEAYLEGDRLAIYLEPIGSAKLTVDDKPVRSKVRLHDGVKIDIGQFSYQFEDTQLYKKVDVVYRNRRKISGILDASAMDAEGLRISPMDAVSPSERARVNFADIRSITFHRRVVDMVSGKPRSVAKPEAMKRVELMFRRGDIVSGYVQREYVEGRRRYVEILPLDPKSEIEYTVVDYSSVVEKKEL